MSTPTRFVPPPNAKVGPTISKAAATPANSPRRGARLIRCMVSDSPLDMRVKCAAGPYYRRTHLAIPNRWCAYARARVPELLTDALWNDRTATTQPGSFSLESVVGGEGFEPPTSSV